MNITLGQWLLAVLAAVVAHACLLGLFLLSDTPPAPRNDPPRGVMVSLDAFDPGPPPASTAERAPIEAAQPDTPATSAPAPVAESRPGESGTAAAATPEPAADVGPQPAESGVASASNAPLPGSPSVDATRERAALAPQIASAVTIRPDDISESVAPPEQVRARRAEPGNPGASGESREPANGAFGTSDQSTDDYIVRLRAWLARHKQYPAAARSNDVEGTVRLYLVIDANGKVLSQRVVESSGSDLLDQAAKQMLARAEPLPRMSASMRRNRLELVVPVVFSLR